MSEKLRRMTSETLAAFWCKGEPDKPGYYLVAWRHANTTQIMVSELWYNPDALYRWWFSRGYTGETPLGGIRGALTTDIVAWMPMPDPPKE